MTDSIKIGGGVIPLSRFKLSLEKFKSFPIGFKSALFPLKTIDEIDVILTDLYNTVNVSEKPITKVKSTRKRTT